MAAEIELTYTLTESHNSLGAAENYHAPLRRMYKKVRIDFPHIDKEVLLALANTAMNDTCGPEGLVPSLLVFGVVLCMLSGNSVLV